MHNLQDLYVEQLRDILNAEKQLTVALPQMASASSSDKLKKAFNHHLDQTRKHIKRLEQVFDLMGMSAQDKTCEAMEGLIEEARGTMAQDGDTKVKDAALIASAQRIEHYEIAAYGTICTYAEELGHNEALDLLKATLNEEKKTDSKLTNLAVNTINPEARSYRWDTRHLDAETVVALYNNFTNARAAIEELVRAGFDRNRLSFIASDHNEEFTAYVREMDIDRDTDDPDAEDGTGFGAIVGALTGLGVALIPGLGGFVVAGAAGAALFSGVGAITGAITGGLTAGLIDLGVDEDRAEVYTDHLRDGGVLVLAHTYDEWEDQAESIMRNHNPVDVDEIEREVVT